MKKLLLLLSIVFYSAISVAQNTATIPYWPLLLKQSAIAGNDSVLVFNHTALKYQKMAWSDLKTIQQGNNTLSTNLNIDDNIAGTNNVQIGATTPINAFTVNSTFLSRIQSVSSGKTGKFETYSGEINATSLNGSNFAGIQTQAFATTIYGSNSISLSNNNLRAFFSLSKLTANRFDTLPDKSGTFAMLSDIPVGLPPSGAAGGSLTGTYPNPTLGTGVVGVSNLSATGTPSSTTYLRGDNTWATVVGGVSSFNTRTGAVVPASSDYSFSQISGAANLTTQVTGTLPIANGGTGNTIGNAATVTTNANLTGDITSVGNATTASGALVKSVVLNTPNVIFTNPVTFSTSTNTATGTLALNTQTQNKVFASPISGTGVPTFRGLDLGDMPLFAGYTKGIGFQKVTATDNAFTAIQKLEGNQDANVIPIYTEDFSSGTIAANWDESSAPGRFIRSGTNINVANGNTNFSYVLRNKNYKILSDRYTCTLEYTLTTVGDKGLGMGLYNPTSLGVYYAYLDTSTPSTSTLRYQAGPNDLSGCISSSASSFACSINDKIRIVYTRLDYKVFVTALNLTTGQSMSLHTRLMNGSLMSTGIGVHGFWDLVTLAGQQSITSFKIEDNNSANSDYFLISDSIGMASNSLSQNENYVDILRNNGVSIIRMASSGSKASDYIDQPSRNYMIKIGAKTPIIAIGINGIGAVSTELANIATLVSNLSSDGFKTPIICNVSDKSGSTTNVNTYNAGLVSAYITTNTFVDIFNAQGLATSSNPNFWSDLLHWTAMGQRNAANTILPFLNKKNTAAEVDIYTKTRLSRVFDQTAIVSLYVASATFTNSDKTFTGDFSRFPKTGFIRVFNFNTKLSEYIYYSGRTDTQLLNVQRGLFGVAALSATSQQVFFNSISNIHYNAENSTPHYTTEGSYYSASQVNYAWGGIPSISSSDQYTFGLKDGGNARFLSNTSAGVAITKNSISDIASLAFGYAGTGQYSVNPYLFLYQSDNTFQFGNGAFSGFSSDPNFRMCFGYNDTKYRTTNGGSDVFGDFMFDVSRVSPVGTPGVKAWSFDVPNGFISTLGNNTRRIAVTGINSINTVNTAGSESADLGIYTNSAGSGLALRATFSGTSAYFKTSAGTTTVAPIKFTTGGTQTTTPVPLAIEPATGDADLLFTTGAGTRIKLTNQVIGGQYTATGTATTTYTVTIPTQANTNYKVNIEPTNALTAVLQYATNKTTTSFDVTFVTALTGSVAFDWTLVP